MKYCAVLICMILCITVCMTQTPFIMTQSQAYLLPYPGDCRKYQQCDVSGCFIMTCGIGTEFNPAIGTCDYPLNDRTGCNNRV